MTDDRAHAAAEPGHRTPYVLALSGLAALAVAMGIVPNFAAWVVLRAIPGFASAWVMVFLSAWMLPKLAEARRGDLAGIVYAGVGAGIVFAGLACLVLLGFGASSNAAWLALGVAASIVTAIVWRVLTDESTPGSPSAPAGGASRSIPQFWRLVFCYGAFGLGYIIPATFLPVMAKHAIAAMTSAFAIGQVAGPLLVTGLVHLRNGFAWALIVSAVPLLLAAYLLSSAGPGSAGRRTAAPK